MEAGKQRGNKTGASTQEGVGLCAHCTGLWTEAWANGVPSFSHSANYYVVYPGNTPANHPPTEACMISSKQHRGCRIQGLGPVAIGGGKQPTFHTARAQHTVCPQPSPPV